MGLRRKSSGDPENAGGTDWDAKQKNAGKGNKYTVFGKGKDWGKPETEGGSGGSLSDDQLHDEGIG